MPDYSTVQNVPLGAGIVNYNCYNIYRGHRVGEKSNSPTFIQWPSTACLSVNIHVREYYGLLCNCNLVTFPM